MKLHQGYFLQLSEEELLFLFETLRSVEIDQESSQLVKDLDSKFKVFVDEILLVCDGCGTRTNVEKVVCPIENSEVNLCKECYEARRNY